ncbi:metallophosphoesterase family protein [Sporosarcina newyorkensis]|uniref:metallophosphoesterase family protein n=1 Tax=Sporosarcina newyorkensis TaxID=759851 RepID=UPI0002EE8772|nr:metallophosphoesterase family protein [Sporosarcina newyorkensis]
MQYALLGDIHSSIEDLKAVLGQISIEASRAEIIGLGDLYECTVSKKDLRGQIYSSVDEVIKHPEGFDQLLTFPSVYGNQEERILLLTEHAEPLRDYLHNLPETLSAGEAVIIHGHQWNPDGKTAWLNMQIPDKPIVFHGHTHRSGYTRDQQEMLISGRGKISLSGKRNIVNVGAVVGSREWVLFNAEERTVRFMRAQRG